MSKNYAILDVEATILNENKNFSTHYNDDELLVYLAFPIDFVLRFTDIEKLILFLQNAKQKYIEWKQIAIRNQVKNFSKPINSFTMEVPCSSRIGLEHYLKWHCVFEVSRYGIYLLNTIYTSGDHRYRRYGGFRSMDVKENLKEFIKSKSWIGETTNDIVCNDEYIKRDRYKAERKFYLTDTPLQLDYYSSYGNDKYSLSFIDELETKIENATKTYKEKWHEEQTRRNKNYEEYKKKQDENLKINDLFK